MCVHACVRACMRACVPVCVCIHACMHACVPARVCKLASPYTVCMCVNWHIMVYHEADFPEDIIYKN